MSSRKIATSTILLTIVCGVVIVIFWSFDLIVNITPSMPVGIWRVFRENQDNWVRIDLKGKVILICPQKSAATQWAIDQQILAQGKCDSGSVPLLKKVVGVESDRVEIFGNEIFINGQFVAKRHLNVSFGIKAEMMAYEISKGQVWVIGTKREESFDSRYLGPLSLGGYLGVARPVWVWEI